MMSGKATPKAKIATKAAAATARSAPPRSVRGTRPGSPPAADPPQDPAPGARTAAPTAVPSVQARVHVAYRGSLRVALSGALAVNAPEAHFVTLPLRVALASVAIDADVVVAIDGPKTSAHITILAPDGADASPRAVGERILPTLRFDTEVGNADRHILRNVDKVERFLASLVRQVLHDELVYPVGRPQR